MTNTHQEQLEQYEQVLQPKPPEDSGEPGKAELFELSETLFQYVIGYEQNYLAWCQAMLQFLEERKHPHS